VRVATPGPTAQVSPALRDHAFHPLRVARVVRETADASSFVLEVPTELQPLFAYQAGQFCNFQVRIDGQEHSRCYSMSSSPTVDAEMQVTVKRVPGGLVSNWMNDHLVAGDTVEATPPAGFFQLDATDGPIVALAGGSGITPVFALLKAALATTSRPFRLLYANRDRESIIFRTELDDLARRHADRVVVEHRLDVEHGFVDADAVTRFTDSFADATYYICGPGPFMDVVEQALLAKGVDAGRIHIERFTAAERVALPEPEEDVATQVTIELGGRTGATDHRPGTTILQTARQLGMSPPFSCESGSCATCMAKLVEGTAKMHVNNALTPEEVDDGWVLTCQAVPTSPAVHVVYDYEET
jgi:3-ketosteroid 9alpha-monooxygenase subunit B